MCHTLGLAQVYITHAFGRRRHYRAGYGAPLPSQPEQMPLSPHLMVFWHGEMSERARQSLKTDFEKLTDFLEQQFAEHGQADARSPATETDSAVQP